MGIGIRRAYEPAGNDEGVRVLVDGVWPRGRSRDELQIVSWERALAPSSALRKWFGHEPARWEEFRRRYREELATPARADDLARLAAIARSGTLTLLYGAADTEHNQAVVLREVLEELASTGDGGAPHDPADAADPADGARHDPADAADPADGARHDPTDEADPADGARHDPADAADPADGARHGPADAPRSVRRDAAERTGHARHGQADAADPAAGGRHRPTDAPRPVRRDAADADGGGR